jgi:preprotein translocase subunit YajC
MSASVQPSLVESISSFLPIILVFGAMMWFMSIRPAMKRQKEQDEMMKNLKRGDRVLTSAGFYAEVDKVEDSGNVILKLADGVKLEFQKQAVVAKVKEG